MNLLTLRSLEPRIRVIRLHEVGFIACVVTGIEGFVLGLIIIESDVQGRNSDVISEMRVVGARSQSLHYRITLSRFSYFLVVFNPLVQ